MHPLFHPLYIEYCSYFNGNRDYFECHEVLEEYWKEIAPGERKHPLVGYVQIATGLYHWRRGNTRGALRILAKGYHILQTTTQHEFLAMIDHAQFLVNIKQSINRIEQNLPFEPFALVISNATLEKIVAEKIAQLPVLDPHFIEHKHTLRDRREVIEARNAKLQNKNT